MQFDWPEKKIYTSINSMSRNLKTNFLLLICKKQTNSVIEDEKHVLLHCPRYESLRKELYYSINELCPNYKKLLDDDKFNYLLNSDGPIVKVVARFVYMASLTHSNVSVS